MRYEVRKAATRQIQEDQQNDIYFWDGVVCVRSTAVTIGSPPTTTISVPNLQGVSIAKREASAMSMICGSLVVLLMWLCGFAWIKEFTGLGVVALTLSAWPLYLMFRPRPWEVTLKKGGILGDESFETRSQQWAQTLSDAISRAIIASRSSGSGGQAVAQEAIFPDPVFTRN